MSKVKSISQNTKLAVDFYEESEERALLICNCKTDGLSVDEEPEYIKKNVTIAELHNYVCKSPGIVQVALGDVDGITEVEDGIDVNFGEWYAVVKETKLLNMVLAEIINKREKRGMFPDIDAAIDKAKGLKMDINHVLQITNHIS